MLWSLIKIIVFVVLVAAAAIAGSYLLEMDGGVRVALAGYEVNMSPFATVLALLVLVVGLWLLLKLASLTVAVLRFINGDETALSRYFDRNRERKGYQALTDGLMALASGEPRVAMNKAYKAEKYLNKPELTNLLTAQAAEMAGDTRKAEDVYKRLLKDDSTRFVGVRGIMRQKLAAGDEDTARKLAEKAIALKPKHEEVQDTLLKLQAKARDWSGARETLALKLKQGKLPRDVHKRRDAVLALSEAKAVLDTGRSEEALEAAVEANRLSPDLVPAAALAARRLIEQNQQRKATKLLKKAWEAQPHPDLAAAFAAIEPQESAEARLKRFQPLLRLHPEHRETKLLQAELHIAAEDFPAARRDLAGLVEDQPDSRALTIMAAVERGEGGSDTVVKGWLARALSAPRGPQWVCTNCHSIHSEWVPVCETCQAFDTLSWQVPQESHADSATGVAMLPLIVGGLEDLEAAKEHAADIAADHPPAPDTPAPDPDPSEEAPVQTAEAVEVIEAEVVEHPDPEVAEAAVAARK